MTTIDNDDDNDDGLFEIVICLRSNLAKSKALAFHCLPVQSPPSNKYQVMLVIGHPHYYDYDDDEDHHHHHHHHHQHNDDDNMRFLLPASQDCY